MKPLDGKTVVITGATTGIGKSTAEKVASLGARVVLACRNGKRALPVLDAIAAKHGQDNALFVELDLASLSAVRRAAQQILETDLPIHGLVNNAGLCGPKGLTRDGFELTFGVNYLGHFLLTSLLIERLLKSGPARVVNLASVAHYGAHGIPFERLQRGTASLTGFPEYRISKLAMVLFTKALARRLEGTGVNTYAVHPGVVASDIWRMVPTPLRQLMKLFMLDTERGARTSVYCVSSPDCATQSGLYYDQAEPREPSHEARDVALADELWNKSVEWTGAEWPIAS